MKKGCLITAIVTLILIITIVICLPKALDLSTPPTYITGYSLGVKGSIKFLHVGGALSTSCIQVRKIDKETNDEYLLENYKGYDNMVGYCLHGDSITIFLRKGYWMGKQSSTFVECDTFHLNINDVKWEIK